MARILMIEDDDLMADLMRTHLVEAGHTVRLSTDSAAGIMALLVQQPDLVLLDLALPYLDGQDILEAMKGDPATSRIPVIVITARSDAANKARAQAAGVDDYLVKPILREQLLAAVDKQLQAAAR